MSCVQVTLPIITSLAEFEQRMSNLISEDGDLGNLVASGDTHGATQLIGALSSILDSLGNNANFSYEAEKADLEEKLLSQEILLDKQRIEIEKQILELEEAIKKRDNETRTRIKVRI